jgi:hypothetical protein
MYLEPVEGRAGGIDGRERGLYRDFLELRERVFPEGVEVFLAVEGRKMQKKAVEIAGNGHRLLPRQLESLYIK